MTTAELGSGEGTTFEKFLFSMPRKRDWGNCDQAGFGFNIHL